MSGYGNQDQKYDPHYGQYGQYGQYSTNQSQAYVYGGAPVASTSNQMPSYATQGAHTAYSNPYQSVAAKQEATALQQQHAASQPQQQQSVYPAYGAQQPYGSYPSYQNAQAMASQAASLNQTSAGYTNNSQQQGLQNSQMMYYQQPTSSSQAHTYSSMQQQGQLGSGQYSSNSQTQAHGSMQQQGQSSSQALGYGPMQQQGQSHPLAQTYGSIQQQGQHTQAYGSMQQQGQSHSQAQAYGSMQQQGQTNSQARAYSSMMQHQGQSAYSQSAHGQSAYGQSAYSQYEGKGPPMAHGAYSEQRNSIPRPPAAPVLSSAQAPWWSGAQAKNNLINALARVRQVLHYEWQGVGTQNVVCRVKVDQGADMKVMDLIRNVTGISSTKFSAAADLINKCCQILDSKGLLTGRKLSQEEIKRYCTKTEKLKKRNRKGGGGGGAVPASAVPAKFQNKSRKPFAAALYEASLSGDADGAMKALRELEKLVSMKELVWLLKAVCGAGQLPLLPLVSGELKRVTEETRTLIPHKDTFLMLRSIPERSISNGTGVAIDEILGATDFPEATQPGVKAYAMRQAKLIFFEYLDEAKKKRDALSTTSFQRLERQRSAAIIHLIGGPGRKKKQDVNFVTRDANQVLWESFKVADCVALSYYREARLSMIEGDVVSVTEDKITIRFRPKASWIKLRSQFGHGPYRIDKMGNRPTLVRMLNALEAFSGGGRNPTGIHRNAPDPDLVSLIVSSYIGAHPAAVMELATKPIISAAHQHYVRNSLSRGSLNPSQKRAIESACASRFTLIQGPPGTGKTHVSIRVILEWISNNNSVLAVAGTNVAADNLVQGIAKHNVNVLRLGKKESIRPDLHKFSVCRLDEMFDTPQDRHNARIRAIKSARVICATCSGAATEMLEKIQFDVVLCDEATQTTEPETLMAICKGVKQVVLVGDHCQLPPTVTSQFAFKHGLALPLFTRLVGAGVRPCMLDTQYRMHPSISEFPADLMYGGLLNDGIGHYDRPVESRFPWPNPQIPIAFFHVRGRESEDRLSYFNGDEIVKTKQIINMLSEAGFNYKDIGVISPYSAQVRMLKSNLRDLEVEISSVDGFQGREKEAIVFSAVRSNTWGRVGFLRDWRRVNVMLTRARRALVIVGSIDTLLAEEQTWRHWITWARTMGVVVGEQRLPQNIYDKKMIQHIGLSRLHEASKYNVGSSKSHPLVPPPSVVAKINAELQAKALRLSRQKALAESNFSGGVDEKKVKVENEAERKVDGPNEGDAGGEDLQRLQKLGSKRRRELVKTEDNDRSTRQRTDLI